LKWPWQKEERAEEERAEVILEPTVDATLLEALLGRTAVSREQALAIPAVKSCINFIADTVTLMPIKLYKIEKGSAEEVEDVRTKLLNDDTNDTLDAVQFWRAMISDYFLGKGGYAYLNRYGNDLMSINYVEDSAVSILKNSDPIFKLFKLYVNGKEYWPHEFLKILRNTRDGSKGVPITEEHALVFSVSYNSLMFEENLVKKGGNKKGFLKSEKKLTDIAIAALKEAWKNLYSNNTESVVVLNDGLSFQESSNTSVEMQLNENKKTNSEQICKLFNVSANVISGSASRVEYVNSFKMAVMPVLRVIESALNKEMLLETEKGSYYFSFDTKEMLKGDIKERFEAYKIAIEANFMQIDEVRYLENIPSLGIKWIKLGLDSVLYDVENKTIYTPNTNELVSTGKKKGGELNESGD